MLPAMRSGIRWWCSMDCSASAPAGPLREPIAGAHAARSTLLRETANAQVFAIDLPTGLDGDTGDAAPDCIEADCHAHDRLSPKRGLLADGATHFVGRLAVLPLAELTARATENVSAPRRRHCRTTRPAAARAARSIRTRATTAGSASSLAREDSQARRCLAAEACVHAGAGLVTPLRDGGDPRHRRFAASRRKSWSARCARFSKSSIPAATCSRSGRDSASERREEVLDAHPRSASSRWSSMPTA